MCREMEAKRDGWQKIYMVANERCVATEKWKPREMDGKRNTCSFREMEGK
jgi:hypothetical protein